MTNGGASSVRWDRRPRIWRAATVLVNEMAMRLRRCSHNDDVTALLAIV